LHVEYAWREGLITAVQNYTYDELNRLKSAVENVTPSGGSASQSWKQDAFSCKKF